ncbi:beta-L-arabinofuranosidase domain-containing protein [Bacillus sp. SD088]|uniref:beta-L-arabinofuranosidase domain-containing protein n=1 Tax=Bacillus sp. SD088 TaxID=2782012 RepID=UPI001A96C830|nr:beta-L-arabinofuranosidase domain-containing protein [Bacillus sp. SD088]MBO0993183.1 glycoside hydrolase family 127 protein [Bacillus sp. SD088]
MNINTNTKLKDEAIAKQDVADIYLGNLGTVDTDLQLPKVGKRESRFNWKSSEILFINHKGEVTRPTYGVGNREVTLTVTAEYGEVIIYRDFVATVLEEVPQNTIVEIYDLELTKKEAMNHLPSVCVVTLDDQSYSTAEVTWLENLVADRETQVIFGQVAGSKQLVKLTIKPDMPIKSETPEKLVTKPVNLLGDSIYRNSAERMLEHLRKVCVDQLLYSFREAAGLSTENAEPMTGWDSPEGNLRGHTTGHYLSALSLAFYGTSDLFFQKKVDYLVSELAKCQKAMEKQGMHSGYLGAYDEEQFDLLERYTTYPTIWAPYYTLDKILTGLLDSYEFARNQQGLSVAMNIGNWVYKRLHALSRQQLNKMWSIYIAGEFGGMISAMMRLYRFTKEEQYLATAFLFENDKLFIPMAADMDTLNGVHANQHIPQIIGALDIYEETGEEKYLAIAENFWQMVVHQHAYSIGGVGETEMFKQANHIAKYLTTKNAESCASYNMLKLTKKLFDLNQKAYYFDYYENTLHNHLLAAASHSCDGGTTYFMPLSPGGKKKFDTKENTCCHGTGLETMLRFQKDIYAFKDTTVYINLFYPSQVHWQEKNVILKQKLHDDCLSLQIYGSETFTLMIRVPTWANIQKVMIDGNLISYQINDGFIQLEKNWQDSQISIFLTPITRIHRTNDNKNIFSITYGQDLLVYCCEEVDFQLVTSEEISQKIQVINNRYFLGNRELRPLNQINDEHYHAYFMEV